MAAITSVYRDVDSSPVAEDFKFTQSNNIPYL
jgi:hypothetical protein